MRELDAMLPGPDPLANAIPEQHRAVVGRAIVMKRCPSGRAAFGGRMCGRTLGGVPPERIPDGDALRMRYGRAIAKPAAAMMRRAAAT